MMFQFLSGRRPPNASTSSNSSEELEAAWAYEEAGHEHSGRNTGRYADQAHQVSALTQTSSCCVEKACAIFHKAQDLLVVTTGDNDEIDPEFYAQRDEALKRVRGLAGRTRNAVQAKKRVLDVMRDWLLPMPQRSLLLRLRWPLRLWHCLTAIRGRLALVRIHPARTD